jgi:hypothetical protein
MLTLCGATRVESIDIINLSFDHLIHGLVPR